MEFQIYWEMRPLEKIMQNEWEKLGPVKFDKNDIDFANKIRSTFTETEILDSFQRIGIKAPLNLPLCDFVAPLDSINNGGIGSTDVGDVSWVVPTVQARVATCAVGTPFHTWQTVAQGKSAAAHKGMDTRCKNYGINSIFSNKKSQKNSRS